MIADALLGGASSVLLLGGLALATIGLFGLILKPDIFDQLHVAGLVTGPGVILVLLASIGLGSTEMFTSALLVVAFVLVTASISTHVIAHAGVRRYGWAPDRAAPDATAVVEAPEAPEAPTDAAAARPVQGTGMRVVIAHDASESADVAATLAAAIDWPAGTKIRLVGATSAAELPSIDAVYRAGQPTRRREAAHVPAEETGAPAVEPREDRRPDDRDEPTSAALDAAARSLERPGIEVDTTLRSGDPADVVVEETTRFGADLLITGSRRRGFVQSLLGWSAAGEIVDRAPCPVLVARSPALRSIMLTTDGSAQSAAAAELVATWPVFDLTPVHVITIAADPVGAPGSASASAAQRIADATAARLMDAGRDVMIEVVQGRPAERIVAASKGRGVDLIVIGSRGRTGLGRTLLGSVAGEVLQAAECSVLVVAPRPRRPDSPRQAGGAPPSAAQNG